MIKVGPEWGSGSSPEVARGQYSRVPTVHPSGILVSFELSDLAEHGPTGWATLGRVAESGWDGEKSRRILVMEMKMRIVHQKNTSSLRTGLSVRNRIL